MAIHDMDDGETKQDKVRSTEHKSYGGDEEQTAAGDRKHRSPLYTLPRLGGSVFFDTPRRGKGK